MVLPNCDGRLPRLIASRKPEPAILKGKGTTMPKKAPWHSIKQDVHHNNTECNTGNNIETENLREGTGGKPLCQECARCNAAGQ
jgi:hypothetical protein